MLTATLGGLIKDHRLRKRLSQLEVSLKIGWSDATRLSKIEQGRVGKPTRKTLDKIMDALELDVYQRGEMLKVGTRIPESTDRDNILKKLIAEVTHLSYPVLIVDTFWTTYYVNDKFIKLFQLSEECVHYINNNNPNWLELLFLTNFIKSDNIRAGNSEKCIKEYKNYQVSQFKYEMSDYLSEAWLTMLIKKLMKSSEFYKIWTSINEKKVVNDMWYDYEYYEIQRGSKRLSFHVCTLRPIFDPRFNYIMHFPADQQSLNF